MRPYSSSATACLVASCLAVVGYQSSNAPLFFASVSSAIGGFAWLAARAVRSQPRLAAVAVGISFVLLGFVFVELVFRIGERWVQRTPARPVYGYEAAVADPDGFRRWWQGVVERWQPDFLMPDPRGVQPYLLKPGASIDEHGARVNRLGFRGREITEAKGSRYRIVALGESTTFGLTHLPTDRPWPDLLEERVREELECALPVQVVNAGVPGWSLVNNVFRLRHDIVPLDPDLVVSYHGNNGFSLFFEDLPEMTARPPTHAERPSLVLGRFERALRLSWFRRRYHAVQQLEDWEVLRELDASRYAGAYGGLVKVLGTAGVPLAICSFNMAVTRSTPEEVIRFYEQTFPDARARILANQLHNRLARSIADSNNAIWIDTSIGLDGAYRDGYVDLIHFTQLGRERLAHHVFEGIREHLVGDPTVACRPRVDGR